MKRMNIFYYGVLKTRKLGTESVHIYEVLTSLLKEGHNLIYLNTDRPESEEEIVVETKSSILERLGETSPIFWLLLYFLAHLRIFLIGFVVIMRQKSMPDVAYIRHTLFNSGYFLAKFFKIPVVKEVNGIVVDEMEIAGRAKGISLHIIDKIERFTLPRADKIIVVTSRLKETLQRDYGIPEDKMVEIQNGANTELFKPISITEARKKLNLDKNYYYICYSGTFAAYQGIDYFIRSAPYILGNYPNTRFLMVGDGSLRKELTELSEQIGVSEKFIFTGAVPYEKVPLHINACDVCVAPFVKARNERCGLSPLKMCEYLACEKPVVTTDINDSGMKGLLEETNAGILVEPENPQELAEAIIKLLKDKKLREEMGRRGREYVVKNRSWESVARRVAEVCESAVREHKNKKR